MDASKAFFLTQRTSHPCDVFTLLEKMIKMSPLSHML
ncbi:RING-type domain-containing protein [Psidium guajava]|nr:RING-type domain-containing protein [Psidium guajava]